MQEGYIALLAIFLISFPQLSFSSNSVSNFVVSALNDTAVKFDWLYSINNPSIAANVFNIEFAIGAYSDDFYLLDSVSYVNDGPMGQSSISLSYTAVNLSPASGYRFRVIPIATGGSDRSSAPIFVYTRSVSTLYWEPILPQRLNLAGQGAGFSNPVLGRPYLDTGPEVFTAQARNDTGSFSDPPTAETPAIPSERRGHSLTAVGKYAFLFGGRTIGYSCSSIYIDNLNLGNTESGRYIYPCTKSQAEVNELWSFDLNTYTWEFLNTSLWGSASPQPREQHSAVNIGGDVFIFGGKARPFNASSDIVYGDIWKLTVEKEQIYNLSSGARATPLPINQSQTAFWPLDPGSNPALVAASDATTPRHGRCIDKIIVEVELTHPCLNQIALSLRGPGPYTGSPNFFPSGFSEEVILMSGVTTNGTGCLSGKQKFIFDDDASQAVDTCCVQHFNGTYKPMGRLGTFIGTSMNSEWTLVAKDLKYDTLEGAVISWRIIFAASPCYRRFTWTKLIVSGNIPAARYGAKTISYKDSFFLMDGRDSSDRPLHDLYRFDVSTSTWTALTPVGVPLTWSTASSVGSSYLLTVWGLIRFGVVHETGYYRQATLTSSKLDNYDDGVFLLDPITLRWRQIQVDPWPQPDGTFGEVSPSPRYLAAAVFVSSNAFPWTTTGSALYDSVDSVRLNHQGTVADSVLIMGGFDGATGSVFDGSSGGLLGDMWMLRLSQWSGEQGRVAQQNSLDSHCKWRRSAMMQGGNPAYSATTTWAGGCLSATSGSSCDLADVITLAWCSMGNQTIS